MKIPVSWVLWERLDVTAQVGDTLNTDIELAVRSGMRSLLVLSALESMLKGTWTWGGWGEQLKVASQM